VNRTCVNRQFGSLFLVHHSAEPPTNEEWNGLMVLTEQAMRAHGSLKVLVLTDGGHPSAAQRAALIKAYGTGTIHTAILTPSMVVRTVTTALQWWNPEIVAFSPDDLPKAIEFLRLEPGMRGTIERAFGEMRREVAQSLTKAPVP
jgi:hypothetical protein